MSAQPTTQVAPGRDAGQERAPLRLLPAPRSILSPLGFGLLVAALVIMGLVTVMVVSTSVAAQSRELASLRKEATELSYTSAALTTELQSRSSTSSLALRAKELGMVPNPYPAFIRLSDGEILGDPKTVEGEELGFLNHLSAPAKEPSDPPEILIDPEGVRESLEQAALGSLSEDDDQ